MEYFLVHFDPADIRDVLLDGVTFGKTEDKLMAPAGTYVVNLSGAGYTPAQWSGVIAATDPDAPMQITFMRAVPPPAAPSPSAPGLRKPKVRKKKSGPVA